jgi:hypothetical protein
MDSNVRLVPPAVFNAGELIAVSVYQNSLKTAAASVDTAKTLYAASTTKAAEACTVVTVQGKRLIVRCGMHARGLAAFTTLKASQLSDISLARGKEFYALTAKATSFSVANAGKAYSAVSVKGKELASYSYAQSKVLSVLAYMKLAQLYSLSSVQAKNAFHYTAKTATELGTFIVNFAKFLMVQLDNSVVLAGKTASSVASFAAIKSSKIYSHGMVYLKPQTG